MMKVRFKLLRKSIFAFCFLQATGLQGQKAVPRQVFDTLPNNIRHYENRLTLFSKEPFEEGGLVFLGNSITEQGEWKKLTDRKDAVNRGIGGDITYGVMNRLDEIVSMKPKKLFLMIGINDIGKDIPESVVADNVRKIISRLKSECPSTAIYVLSILPVNPEHDSFPQNYDKAYQILLTNQLLYKTAKEEQVNFINLFPWFLDSRQRMRIDLVTDGLHLNEKGYRLWIEILNREGYL